MHRMRRGLVFAAFSSTRGSSALLLLSASPRLVCAASHSLESLLMKQGRSPWRALRRVAAAQEAGARAAGARAEAQAAVARAVVRAVVWAAVARVEAQATAALAEARAGRAQAEARTPTRYAHPI